MPEARTLALITARGGSKGVPGKNIRMLGGVPLIVHSIRSALECRELFYRVIVSTDDEEIANISREAGAEVPFIRPAELASDQAKSWPVLQHAVQWVEENDGIKLDWVFLLQPTAPFRNAEDVRAAMGLALGGDCDSVISVVRVLAEHPALMKRIENETLVPFNVPEPEGTRRQDYRPKAYMRNGAIYITKRDVLMEQDSIWGDTIRPYVMPEERSISIDTETHFAIAERHIVDHLGSST